MDEEEDFPGEDLPMEIGNMPPPTVTSGAGHPPMAIHGDNNTEVSSLPDGFGGVAALPPAGLQPPATGALSGASLNDDDEEDELVMPPILPGGDPPMPEFEHDFEDASELSGDDDFAPTAEEEALLREIEDEQREEESARGSQSRAALLATPLLMAATMAVDGDDGQQPQSRSQSQSRSRNSGPASREYPPDPPSEFESRSDTFRSDPPTTYSEEAGSRSYYTQDDDDGQDDEKAELLGFAPPPPTLDDLSKEQMMEAPYDVESVEEKRSNAEMNNSEGQRDLGSQREDSKNDRSVEDDDYTEKDSRDDYDDEEQLLSQNYMDDQGFSDDEDNEEDQAYRDGRYGNKNEFDDDSGYGNNQDHGAYLEQYADENFPQKSQNRNMRKWAFRGGWLLVLGLAAGAVTVPLMRRNDDVDRAAGSRTRTPTVSPYPTSSPTVTAEPTKTPVPTMTPEPTIAPTITPVPTPRDFTLSPTKAYTNKPSKSLGSGPTAFPTAFPTRFPTVRPTLPIQPTPITEDETERRRGISSLVIELSGLGPFLEPNSPQNLAYNWLLEDDAMKLSASDVPAIIQRYSLASLYFATDGDKWTNCGRGGSVSSCPNLPQRFLSGASECLWFGADCDADGYIDKINLRENGLIGTLVPEMAELTRLETLVLSRNSLGSSVPTELGRLNQLRFLLLNRNSFSGSIPTELGNLNRLWYIHLGNNLLTGPLPGTVFAPTLQHVDFGDNRLTGTLPMEMTLISKDLINIDVSKNQFTGSIPVGLGSLTGLSSFTGNENDFSGQLAGAIFNDRMTIFDVSQNRLSGLIPNGLFNLGTSLTLLNLAANKFEGTIPSQFGDLVNLEQLAFWFNDFVGTVPTTLGLLSNLEVLHFGETDLFGTMPAEVCELRTDEDGLLATLSADCGGSPPMLACDCCTQCFESN